MSHDTLAVICVLGCLFACYFLGSFQPSFLLGLHYYKRDIRNEGSMNSGATNAIRVFGFKFGMLCMTIDAIKGGLGVLFARYMLTADVVGSQDATIVFQLLAGIFIIIGHNHPFYMGFRGGKGVSVSLGIMAVINWKIFLIACIPAIIILVTTRFMCVASMLFEILCFAFFIVFYYFSPDFYWITIVSSLYPMIAFNRHRMNLARLMSGEEPKLWGIGSIQNPKIRRAVWGKIVNLDLLTEEDEDIRNEMELDIKKHQDKE